MSNPLCICYYYFKQLFEDLTVCFSCIHPRSPNSFHFTAQDVKAKHRAEYLANSGEADMDLSDSEDVQDAKRRKKAKHSSAVTSTPETAESIMNKAQGTVGFSFQVGLITFYMAYMIFRRLAFEYFALHHLKIIIIIRRNLYVKILNKHVSSF